MVVVVRESRYLNVTLQNISRVTSRKVFRKTGRQLLLLKDFYVLPPSLYIGYNIIKRQLSINFNWGKDHDR